MKRYLAKLFLQLEYSVHRVDAHLAQMRGDSLFAADCLTRAWDIERRIAIMEIN